MKINNNDRLYLIARIADGDLIGIIGRTNM